MHERVVVRERTHARTHARTHVPAGAAVLRLGPLEDARVAEDVGAALQRALDLDRLEADGACPSIVAYTEKRVCLGLGINRMEHIPPQLPALYSHSSGSMLNKSSSGRLLSGGGSFPSSSPSLPPLLPGAGRFREAAVDADDHDGSRAATFPPPPPPAASLILLLPSLLAS